MPNLFPEVGRILRAARLQNGLTQEDLARAVGSTTCTISKTEHRGRHLPAVDLRRLIDAVCRGDSQQSEEARRSIVAEYGYLDPQELQALETLARLGWLENVAEFERLLAMLDCLGVRSTADLVGWLAKGSGTEEAVISETYGPRYPRRRRASRARA